MLPNIICHMVTSIDGKVTGKFLADPNCAECNAEYFRQFHEFRRQTRNWLCGRVSFQEAVVGSAQIDTSRFKGQVIDRTDFIFTNQAEHYAIALDPEGKLGWTQNRMGDSYPDPLLKDDRIITVLSENVADEYLLYLREIGVSYIFAGKNKPLDMRLMVQKLGQYFDFKEILLAGGGWINGSLMREGLINKINVLQVPLVANDNNAVSLFQSNQDNEVQTYQLTQNQVLAQGILHLQYQKI